MYQVKPFYTIDGFSVIFLPIHVLLFFKVLHKRKNIFINIEFIFKKVLLLPKNYVLQHIFEQFYELFNLKLNNL